MQEHHFDHDYRARRLRYRAWHRGIKEMDLIFGQYVDAHFNDLQKKDIIALEYIMSFEDRDLLSYFTKEVAIPADLDTPLFHDILDFRDQMEFN